MRTFGRSTVCLTLVLLLALLIPIAGNAAGESKNMSFWMRRDGVEVTETQSVAAVGDTLYLLAGESLYSYHLGETEPTAMMDGLDTMLWVDDSVETEGLNVSFLFAMNGSLYGFGMRSGAVTRLADESGAAVRELAYTLDASLFRNGDVYPRCVFYADGKLYLLAEGAGTTLYEYALADGAAPVEKRADDLIALGAYQPGFLVGVSAPYADNSDEVAKVVRYELATGEKTTLYSTGIADYAFGVTYDPAADTVYYGMDCRVYACSSASPKPATVAYLPERCTGFQLMLQAGALAAWASPDVHVRALSGADGQVLTVEGEYGSREHMAVVQEHPEMVISPSSAYTGDIQTLTAAMVSGESAMDVLKLNPEYQPVESLIDKGYAANLNAFPEIVAVAEQMDPRFLEPFQRDGGLYALPVYSSVMTVCVNRQAWTEELGLSLDELPTTYPELLDFIDNYDYDYGEDHPNLALTVCWDLRAELLTLVLRNEGVYQTQGGVDRLDFDTPRFHKLINAIDRIDYSHISMAEMLGPDATDSEYNEFFSKTVIFDLYYGVDGPDMCVEDSPRIPLVLALDEGLQPVLPASLNVLMINVKSTRQEQAAVYVASYASHLNAVTDNLTLFPGHNDDVPNPNYEVSLQQAQEWLADRQKAYDTASPENKASLADEVEYAKLMVEDAENAHYLARAKDIAAYRETICPYLLPITNSAVISTGSGNADSSIRTLLNQFAEQAIDADTFIRSLNNRIRLRTLENQ